MPKYIAFLRAINVGGHIVKMDHLRRLFEALGFDNVEMFIARPSIPSVLLDVAAELFTCFTRSCRMLFSNFSAFLDGL
jgi:hypothetical protein